jgi:hypothetical protein
MKRHSPVEDLMETAVRARTAVSSRWLASAAAEGCNIPPAPETGAGVVRFADAGSTSGDADVTAASIEEAGEATNVSADALDFVSINRVTVTMVVEIHAAGVDAARTLRLVTGET